MLELFPEGFEEVDSSDSVELVAYTDAGGEERLWHVFGGARAQNVAADWRDRWKAFHHPVQVGPLWIGPPWADPPPAASTVVIEPGRAFGTGLHETTSLVAEAMASLRERVRGATVLDVGCGSGILALTALVLGASRARAIDVDADVVDVVRENAVRNRLADRVEVDTTPVEALPGEFAIVLANIEADVLVRLARAIAAKVAPGGLLVLSGVLVPQKERVLAAYTALGLGLELVDAPEKGEWIAIVLARA